MRLPSSRPLDARLTRKQDRIPDHQLALARRVCRAHGAASGGRPIRSTRPHARTAAARARRAETVRARPCPACRPVLISRRFEAEKKDLLQRKLKLSKENDEKKNKLDELERQLDSFVSVRLPLTWSLPPARADVGSAHRRQGTSRPTCGHSRPLRRSTQHIHFACIRPYPSPVLLLTDSAVLSDRPPAV